MDQKIAWTTRRSNILVAGVELENTTGKLLKVGTYTLEITAELDPCNRMDEQVAWLTNALVPNWRGGVTCKIIEEGIVNIADEVLLLENTK